MKIQITKAVTIDGRKFDKTKNHQNLSFMQKMIDVTSGTFDHTVYILDFLRGEGLRKKIGG